MDELCRARDEQMGYSHYSFMNQQAFHGNCGFDNAFLKPMFCQEEDKTPHTDWFFNGQHWTDSSLHNRSHFLQDKELWDGTPCDSSASHSNHLPVGQHHLPAFFPHPHQPNFPVAQRNQCMNIIFQLEDEALWEEFNEVTNEMIVTKSGRRMFPVLRVKIQGLEPESFYSVFLDFLKVDSNKWKFVNGEWTPNGGKCNSIKIIHEISSQNIDSMKGLEGCSNIFKEVPKQMHNLYLRSSKRVSTLDCSGAKKSKTFNNANNFFDFFKMSRTSNNYQHDCIRIQNSANYSEISAPDHSESPKDEHATCQSSCTYNVFNDFAQSGTDIAGIGCSASYQHPDSPNFGRHWNSKPIAFTRVKISNKNGCPFDQIYLDSLHKYIPRVAVVRIGNKKNNEENIVIADYCFEKASFVAVTAYQNEEVTNLKVKYNPFAKGFQERKSSFGSTSPNINCERVEAVWPSSLNRENFSVMKDFPIQSSNVGLSDAESSNNSIYNLRRDF